uniref:Uncharacterized protein n=1 Tax=Acrobeloides nanus TaxID=290746 RepID=A0A914D9V8_9BILA
MYSTLRRNPDINDPEYFKCCCGVHVKQGALVIAIISIVGGVLQLFSGTAGSILSAIIIIVAGALIIYADRQEKAWAYIPYLVMKALAIIVLLIGIFVLLVLDITEPQWLIDELAKKRAFSRDQFRTDCFVAMVIVIIAEAFAIWFWFIVFRAYRYMREVLGGPSLGDNYE